MGCNFPSVYGERLRTTNKKVMCDVDSTWVGETDKPQGKGEWKVSVRTRVLLSRRRAEPLLKYPIPLNKPSLSLFISHPTYPPVPSIHHHLHREQWLVQKQNSQLTSQNSKSKLLLFFCRWWERCPMGWSISDHRVTLDPSQPTLTDEQRADLKNNIQIMRDAIVLFTATGAARGVSGHTGQSLLSLPQPYARSDGFRRI